MTKHKKANKRGEDRRNRPLNELAKQRGCKNCGRWALLSRKVYQDSGELCSAESCPNAITEDDDAVDIEHEKELMEFRIAHESFDLYVESAALNEKSEDSPASDVTKTSTSKEP